MEKKRRGLCGGVTYLFKYSLENLAYLKTRFMISTDKFYLTGLLVIIESY